MPNRQERGIKIGVTLPRKTLQWIDNEIELGKYHNRSHAVIKLAKDEEGRSKLG
jgi:Arc/MetJ-type ribon-helix-helix transcriptional regulator